jgi:cardiolipin synthase
MSTLVRNIPNVLTGLRLLLAPLAAFFILQGLFGAALSVFTFAGLSDAADGYLAKRFQLETRFGAWLDPAADKLLMLVCFLALSHEGITPLWLTVLVIGRDAAIVLGVLLAKLFALPVRVEPLPMGKISTIVQIVYIGLMLAFVAFRIDSPSSVEALSVLTAAATILSWLAYAQVFLRALLPGSKTA